MSKKDKLLQINEILAAHLVPICTVKIDEVKSLLDKLSSFNDWLSKGIESFNDKGTEKVDHENLIRLKQYHNDKIESFIGFSPEIENPFFNLNPSILIELFNKYISKKPKFKLLEQGQERFHNCPADAWFLKSLKFVKLVSYKISAVPVHLANGTRKIFKKEVKRIPYWKYRLPYQTLLEYHTENILIEKLGLLLAEASKSLVQIMKSALEKDHISNEHLTRFLLNEQQSLPTPEEVRYSLDEEYAQLTKIGEELPGKVAGLVEIREQELKAYIPIAGTIEYPAVYLNYQNRNKKKDRVLTDAQKRNINWGNTAFALLEDWKIDLEIYKLLTDLRLEVAILKTVNSNNSKNTLKYLALGAEAIAKIKENILQEVSKKKNNEVQVIKDELKTLEKNLNSSSLDTAVNTHMKQNLAGNINSLELKLKSSIGEISSKRWLTKLTSYDSHLQSSDLNSFSPSELINFKHLPDLIEGCAKLKSKNIRHIDTFKQDIGNVANIISFNLSTIVESVEAGTSEQSTVIQLVEEAIERSQNKLNDAKNSLLNHENEINESIEEIASNFNSGIYLLTKNENAFELRMLVTKAKALKRTEEIKQTVSKEAIHLYSRLKRVGNTLVEKWDHVLKPIKKRIGIFESTPFIATELSDFLSEARGKINGLPLVYQQLYKIQPLTELSLFTGRKRELEQVLAAYKSWQDGKYSPTVILGEKWTGHTTMINYLIENHTNKKRVIYENRLINIYREDEFIDAWKQILKTDQIESFDSLVNIINSRYKKYVFIIENLQNYYIRAINGFDCLNLMIKLISKTYHQVFWLCTANIYAWEYLNKTIEISNYFGYHINMNPFSDDELKELIMKKNNISGYKIIFHPSSKNLGSSKFNKLSIGDQQLYLQNQFFNKLNEFAKGNISLALTYWLLSTQKITEESIEINDFETPDFSFITSLSSEKVFIIYQLIMHDGLTLEHLNMVYQKPIDKLHLLVIMLQDDGLLIENNGGFEVNPLIFRQSINMLKSRNLIY